MKRKRSNILFFGGRRKRTAGLTKKRDGSDCDEPDSQPARVTDNPQLELLLKCAPKYSNCFPLPRDILMIVFKHVVSDSDNPLKELCNLALVCEAWRHLIYGTPNLWTRIIMSSMPLTDRNISVLSKILQNIPNVQTHVKEVAIGGVVLFKSNNSAGLLETLLTMPNLKSLSFRNMKPQSKVLSASLVHRAIKQCANLESLNIIQSKALFNNQKWLADYLTENGQELQVLNLAMSLTSIPFTLYRSFNSDYCPRLKFLDISTCDALTTHSFDAILFAQNLPNLEVLRVANISFKRVHQAPDLKSLVKLRELSMPIGMRDADRDDALFSTFTYGSSQVTSLDIRGSSISPFALLNMPSYEMRTLHIDDLCPIVRKKYYEVIKKWAKTLEVLSLVKINCAQTIKSCLDALVESDSSTVCKVVELDLSGSDVDPKDLANFLKKAKNLETINLSSCRSLPRGCKGEFSRDYPLRESKQDMRLLLNKLNMK